MLKANRLLSRAFLCLCLCGVAGAKPPPVPARVTELIKSLFESPVYEQAGLSPSGRYLAFIREEAGHKLLKTIDLKTKKVSGVSGSWKQDVVEFHWYGHDQLIFQVGQEKIYYEGLWLADATFDHVKPVRTEGRVLVVYDVRPSYVLLTNLYPPRTSVEDEPFSNLYRLNAGSSTAELAEENPGRVVDWLADGNGRVRFAIRALHDDDYELLSRNGDNGAWKGVPFLKDPFPLSMDPSGHFLLLRYLGENGLLRVGTYDLENRKLLGDDLAEAAYDVNPSLGRDPNTGNAIDLAYETNRGKVVWLDSGYAKVKRRLDPAFPGLDPQPWGLTYDQKILFGTGSDTTPQSCYLFDPRTGAVTLFLPRRPGAAGRGWAPMGDVTFRARDGYELHGYLTLPLVRRDGQRVPLIALSHGGPKARDTWGFDAEAQFFAALGYGVLQVNYRGSVGYGKDHELPDIIAVCRQSVDDVDDGVGWAVTQGYADPRRIVAMGGSYGGYISMALAERYPDTIAAVVGFAGVYDWEEQMKVDSDERSILFHWLSRYYPDRKSRAADYRDVSPVNRADKVRAPVLLLHGGDDQRVEYDQSKEMERALRKAGRPVELVGDVASIHGLPDQQSRFDYYQTVAAFLLQHAPPDGAP